ncbi:ABC transporter ATP-binding protein [Alphaproteobacteria bacterium]|jgi:oligopeptide/dipeptide ABC transporter ATP-binding protein|nr:ABC transporter ATP-binding protein [Alphaproteobacteria bacterium]MDB3892403.1 ABC transporter ATP-binding protein [Alphaproteobacteria bacterium]
MSDVILDVRNLRVEFKTQAGTRPVLDDISFSLKRGERISFVGESGCGKSMTALALMGLLPSIGRIASGQILFKGEDLAAADESRLQNMRGNEISMIFQEPMTSLNPVFTIGNQISEVLKRHRGMDHGTALATAIKLLDAVKIPDAKARINDYPHQLSGGQRQRVMIAIALACEPEILIADEPTTALDVTVQAEIFDLLRDIGARTDTAIILITHDIGAVCQMAERMLVMYAGRKVEEGPVQTIVEAASHPYTRGLISCVPHIRSDISTLPDVLPEIDGIVPSITSFGKNQCLFAPRCDRLTQKCLDQQPPSTSIATATSKKDAPHNVACWNNHGTGA